jgi:hypothetical protein
MGSYTLDSHNVQRYVKPDGFVQNEGDIGVGVPRPYEIAYGAIVPKKAECQNLLVPVCLSSSHIAFGSIRMEPVFMILGQSAATAAAMSIDAGMAVQDLPYARLRERLLADKQVLELAGEAVLRPVEMPGVVIDDSEAELKGEWTVSAAKKPFVGSGYRHDGNADHGTKSAYFRPGNRLKPGRYEIRVYYSAQANRTSQAGLAIHHTQGTQSVSINQREPPPIEGVAISLGEFHCDAESSVQIGKVAGDGYLVIDAVQWLPK